MRSAGSPGARPMPVASRPMPVTSRPLPQARVAPLTNGVRVFPSGTSPAASTSPASPSYSSPSAYSPGPGPAVAYSPANHHGSPAAAAASPAAAAGSRDVFAWAAKAKDAPLERIVISLPPLADDAVEVKVLACGVCASDIDALGKFGGMYSFPLVAGHEGVGVVTECGRLVRHLRVGQRVGLGVYRGACGSCIFCANGQNNLCSVKELMYMNGASGAFAEFVRIKSEFAIPIPDAIQTEHAGPLMCAGVTVFAPFRRHDIKAGQRVGVLGIGGLGHLAIQVAAKFGCEVVALSTSADKAPYAKELGAQRFVCIMNEGEIKPIYGTLDYLLVTASGDSLDYRALLGLLATNGKLIVIGVSFKEQVISPVALLVGQKSICGAAAGSTGVALDMLRFCAVHGIKPMVQTFPFEQCNEAMSQVSRNMVRFRAVLTHPQ